MLRHQGPSVDGSEVRAVLAKYGIERKRSSPYHPEGDGQSERGIQGFKQIMRCLLQEKEIEMEYWPPLFNQVGYILNSIPSASTGSSLYRIMFVVGLIPLSLAVLNIESNEYYYSVL